MVDVVCSFMPKVLYHTPDRPVRKPARLDISFKSNNLIEEQSQSPPHLKSPPHPLSPLKSQHIATPEDESPPEPEGLRCAMVTEELTPWCTAAYTPAPRTQTAHSFEVDQGRIEQAEVDNSIPSLSDINTDLISFIELDAQSIHASVVSECATESRQHIVTMSGTTCEQHLMVYNRAQLYDFDTLGIDTAVSHTVITDTELESVLRVEAPLVIENISQTSIAGSKPDAMTNNHSSEVTITPTPASPQPSAAEGSDTWSCSTTDEQFLSAVESLDELPEGQSDVLPQLLTQNDSTDSVTPLTDLKPPAARVEPVVVDIQSQYCRVAETLEPLAVQTVGK